MSRAKDKQRTAVEKELASRLGREPTRKEVKTALKKRKPSNGHADQPVAARR